MPAATDDAVARPDECSRRSAGHRVSMARGRARREHSQAFRSAAAQDEKIAGPRARAGRSRVQSQQLPRDGTRLAEPGEHDAGRLLDREQHDAIDEPPRLFEVVRLAGVLVHVDEIVAEPGHAEEVRGEDAVAIRELARELPRELPRDLEVARLPERRVEAQRHAAESGGAHAPVREERRVAGGAMEPHHLVGLLALGEVVIEEPPRHVEVLGLPGHLEEPQQEVTDPDRAVAEAGVDVAPVGVEVPVLVALELRLDLGERTDRVIEILLIGQPLEEEEVGQAPPGRAVGVRSIAAGRSPHVLPLSSPTMV